MIGITACGMKRYPGGVVVESNEKPILADERIVEISGVRAHLHIVARMLQLLSDMRGRLGLDAENVHILYAFELAELAHWNCSGGQPTHQQLFNCELSASTVSEMTFIPRQTVRRRLERLCLLGYVSHLGDGRYTGGAKLLELELTDRLRRMFPLMHLT